MKQSKLFSKTKKQAPKGTQAISHKFLIKADFISQVSSGIYNFLPLGWRVYKKIENVIREEMQGVGGEEIFMCSLIPQRLWVETKRWTEIDPPLFKVKDRHKKMFGLGPTHEEIITDLIRKRVKSYKDLPFSLFQIQNKFRNEMRPTGGLLMTRAFIMKDLYSFHSSEKDLKSFYEKVKKAYFRIFKRCGLKSICVEADPGTIGGKSSHEFMVVSKDGEDKIVMCPKCNFGSNLEKAGKVKKCPECKTILKIQKAIEVGHIFALGTKYSEAMKANFTDKLGSSHPIIMGCYGIGLPRLLSVIVEVNHDQEGIVWPQSVAPFDVHLLALENSNQVKKVSEKIYKDLQKSNIKVLYDDREEKTAGQKLIDTDLIGIPWRIVVSERSLSKNCVEIKKRDKKKVSLISPSKIKNLKF